MVINTQYKRFLLLAIVCCLLSVITTLGIHSSLFELGELSFDERIRVFENSKYITSKFWIIAHCLFVLIAMLGFLLIQFKKSPGFTIAGFVFFAVFSFTEIFRQMFVFFYLNNLRRSYIETNDFAIQEMIKINMEHAGLIGYALFGLFIVAFALGNICYGISLFGSTKIDRILAYLLLIWGFGNLIAFGNEFWQSELIEQCVEYFSIIYQPIMRALVGLWMFYKLKQIIADKTVVNPV
ncbi:hypothetical protein [Flavivirga eckloniae]|uniref:DUF4386 domain-containing protein n=1 Tax=Flavivirga eckloniae TaxID=1803846 RepID=A0A2K9PQV8_9FLAO|nr:hypothetical protein [Flavivirga eckloniae]AUP79452.1 hypothetical protein C1H87_12335 [Flavivirga eckloniae]